MSKFQPLKSDDNDEEHDDIAEESHRRRLSLQVQDLPVAHYFARWDCFGCCKKNDSYLPFINEEDEEEALKTGRSSTKSPSRSAKDAKVQQTLMAEQCLDSTVKKIISNLSWVNATLLAVAMKNTLWIDFNNVGTDYESANNAWIYFFVIFIIGIVLAVVPRAFEDLDEMKRELDLKSTQKYNIYIYTYPCTLYY